MTEIKEPGGGEDWSALSRAWTADAPQADPLDAAFVRRIGRRDRLARLNFAGEILGAVAVLVVIAWGVLARGLPWQHAAAALAFTAFAGAMTLWSRRGDPGLLTDTPEAVLRSAIGQARIGERWALAGVAISLAAMTFLVLITLITPATGGPFSPIVFGGLLGLFVCIGFYTRHARRCRRRKAGHEAALAALTTPTGE